MKYFILAFAFLMTTHLIGQVSEHKTALSLGEHNAFVLEHPGADKKMVSKTLEKTFKEYGKVKRNKKAKEWSCLQCDVPGIGQTNIYFKVEEGKGQVTSFVFCDDGTQFVNSENNQEAAAAISKSLKYVGYDVEKQVISKELDREENSVKDRNKELGLSLIHI